MDICAGYRGDRVRKEGNARTDILGKEGGKLFKGVTIHCFRITLTMSGLQGLKFHYVEKGDRSKPLMLMVHGFPEFWYSWRHQMKEFSKDYW